MYALLELFEQQSLFQIVLAQKITYQLQYSTFCNNKLGNKNAASYCHKETVIASKVQTGSVVYSSSESNFHSFYTEKTQNLKIDQTYHLAKLQSFALFGLTKGIQIESSQLSVRVPTQMSRSALVCLECDLNVSASDFVFVAQAHNVSGLVLTPRTTLWMRGSLTQFRLEGVFAGGLLLICPKHDIVIIACNTSSYIAAQNLSGSIAAFSLDVIAFKATDSVLCSNAASKFGLDESNVQVISNIKQDCALCREGFYSYGICLSALANSQLLNNKLICNDPFVFDGEECACPQGETVNGSSCVNIVYSVGTVMESLEQVGYQLIALTLYTSQIDNATGIIGIEQSKMKEQIQKLYELNNLTQNNKVNQTHIELSIINNISKLEYELKPMLNALEMQISNNYSQLNQDLQQNTAVLDTRLFNNISDLNASYNQLNQSIVNVEDEYLVLTENIQKLENSTSRLDDIQSQLQAQIQNLQDLPQQITSNYSQSDMNLLSNTTVLDQRIFNNASILNFSVQSLNASFINQKSDQEMIQQQIQNKDQIIADMKVFYQSQIDYMQDIIDHLESQINCTNQVGNLFKNGTCVQQSCSVIGQKRINGLCQCVNLNAIISSGSCVCPKFATVIDSICTCPANAAFIGDSCVCNVIYGQIIQLGTCVCPAGYVINNNECQLVQTINGFDSSFQCSQNIYIGFFDIQTITHQISVNANFSNGYVFNSQTDLNNAFIDISDNIYGITKINPLFQNQSNFVNIKIQIGTNIINSGSILTPSQTLLLNQMNIISKIGCQLTFSKASQLNLLASTSSNVKITNLLVNLSFALQQGNITLINSIVGVLNITRYQILGTYQSTLLVAMIGMNLNVVTANINFVTFQPSIYNVGNSSSYLLSIVQSSTIIINDIAIILGISNNYAALDSSISSQYQFSGVVTLNNKSTFNIQNIVLDSYLKFSTGNVYQSGFLIGYSSAGSETKISNICLQQTVSSSTTLQYTNFGILGYVNGNILLQQAMIILSVQMAFFNSFGIIGCQDRESLYSEVRNVRANINMNIINLLSAGGKIGAIFGAHWSQNGTIHNIRAIGCNISCNIQAGGLIGYQQNSNILTENSTIQQSNFTSQKAVGGILGYQYTNSVFVVNNCSIVRTNFSGIEGQVGGIIGFGQQNSVQFNNLSLSSLKMLGLGQLGGYCGLLSTFNIQISNSSISDTNISATNFTVGGIIGQITPPSNFTMVDSLISQVNLVTTSYYVGGVVGQTQKNVKLVITNSILKSIRFTYQGSDRGTIVGSSGSATFTITKSSAKGIYFNNALQPDCASLTNKWSYLQCT
ncbi:carboxypeptidase_regulatory-like domain-containing protein [Hexamita inflata]|uniref:Carboxypeptidase_regulatory-like domain-containing protein n=1 Tax=Hexamita inflata TaxID=28002 RepID=A0ABP1KPY4_9EUKA